MELPPNVQEALIRDAQIKSMFLQLSGTILGHLAAINYKNVLQPHDCVAEEAVRYAAALLRQFGINIEKKNEHTNLR